jgi:GNAT superfamily N-acetyltransferase
MCASAGAPADYSDSRVAAWFGSGVVRDPAADTRLVTTDDGTVVAAALVAPPADGGTRADAWGGVRPTWRGRGIGRDLLGWQIDRVRAMRADTDPAAPWEFDTDAYLSEPEALRLFERFGLHAVRYWFSMAMPLDRPPVRPMPAGLRVVAYADDMATAVYEAHVDAFTDHHDYEPRTADQWTELHVRSDDFRGDLSRIAYDGDAIAGFVLASDGDADQVYIDLVGVRGSWRRRGVAAGLLSATLVAAAAAGKVRATIDVDATSPTGADGVYRAIGFTPVVSSVSYRLRLDA